MLIKLQGINKEYLRGGNSFRVLKDIDLQIDRGEYVAIMGPSGAGKTTLIDVIGFLDRDYYGSYEFDGQPVSQMSEGAAAHLRNRAVGFVFQNFKLIQTLTIAENVELPLLYAGMRHSQTGQRVEEALAAVGLAGSGAKRPNELSGGQQQRVAIARAIVNDPDFIIGDEPTGALDSATTQEIMAIFDRLHAAGKTLLLVTHDPKVGARAKRLVRVVDGQIVAGGDRHE